jgi:hypothetical protein
MAGRLMVGASRWWRGGSRRRLGEGCGEGRFADMQTGCQRFGSRWGNGRCRRRWGTARTAASLSLPGIPSLWYDALSLYCHPRFLCPPWGIKPTAATTGRVALLDRVCARVCSSEVELTRGRAAGRIYKHGGEQEARPAGARCPLARGAVAGAMMERPSSRPAPRTRARDQPARPRGLPYTRGEGGGEAAVARASICGGLLELDL